MTCKKARISKPFFLFTLSFFVYFFSWLLVYKIGINETLIQSEDTLPAFFLPASLSLEGDFDLDEYFELLVSRYPQPDGARVPFYLEEVEEHFYSAFPVVTPLLAVPVYFLPLKLGLPISFETISLLGHISAALIVAASVAVMYLVFEALLIPQPPRLGRKPRRFSLAGLLDGGPLLLSFVYAFGTCSFGLSSQSMWQHGASQLMFSLALYFLVCGLKRPNRAVWAGLFLSLATLARPTGAVAVLVLSVYFLKKYGWCHFVRYTFFGLIPLGLFLAVPGAATGVLAGYASQVGSSWTAPFPGGFLGEWFSPSKGVLTYSPVFLFSFLSVWLLWRGKRSCGVGSIPVISSNVKVQSSNKAQSSKPKYFGIWILDLVCHLSFGFWNFLKRSVRANDLFYWIFACVVVHSLIVGKWYSWYGGWAFGYRMMTDMLPFLAFLWIPFVKSPYWEKLKKWFYLAAVYSLGIQLAGIGFYDGVWHGLYDNGSQMGWLWSIRNCEMAYYLRRVIGKLTGVPANQIR